MEFSPHQIGAYLLREGLLRPEQLSAALTHSKQRQADFRDTLIDMGLFTEIELQRHIAHLYQLPYLTKDQVFAEAPETRLLDIFPSAIALAGPFLPWRFDINTNTLIVLIANALTEEQSTQLLQQSGAQQIQYLLTTTHVLIEALEYFYGVHETSDHIAVPHTSNGMGSPVLEGQIVANTWILKHQLGQGGIGMVFQARDLEGGKPAAIKLLRPQFQIQDDVVERFYFESQALKRLKHPNIVEIYQFGYEEKLGFYQAMELLEGSDLSCYTEASGHHLTLQQAAQIFVQICDAMHHSHTRGVIHRDLKPENIFLKGGPEDISQVKLLDFGIAQLKETQQNRLTQTGMVMGTPRYISPEQATGATVDQRSDIYSMSVLLFEVLTRCPVFPATSLYQYVFHHVQTPAPRLSYLRPELPYPPELENLVAEGLSKLPQDRPSSMQEYKQKLLPFLSTPQIIELRKTQQLEQKRMREIRSHASLPKIQQAKTSQSASSDDISEELATELNVPSLTISQPSMPSTTTGSGQHSPTSMPAIRSAKHYSSSETDLEAEDKEMLRNMSASFAKATRLRVQPRALKEETIVSEKKKERQQRYSLLIAILLFFLLSWLGHCTFCGTPAVTTPTPDASTLQKRGVPEKSAQRDRKPHPIKETRRTEPALRSKGNKRDAGAKTDKEPDQDQGNWYGADSPL